MLFLLYPVILELGYVRLFRVFFILVLVAAVFSLGGRRHHSATALGLAIPTALSQAVVLTLPSSRTLLIAVACALVFTAYVTVVVLAAVLRGGKVTGDKIAGAICVYLLLGLAWAMIYGLVALVQPGSFHTPVDAHLVEHAATRAEYGFIYFSFATLTTLGYGDITPASSFARMFAWMEAVVGQLYIAILVARLVALQILLDPDSNEPSGSA